MASPSTPEVRTAIHEAGHATAVHLCGGRLRYVTALPEPDRWGGLVVWAPGSSTPFDEAVVAFAGPTAESEHAPGLIAAALERGETAPNDAADLVLDDPAAPRDAPADDIRAETAERWDLADGHPSDEQHARTLIDELATTPHEVPALTFWLRCEQRSWSRHRGSVG